MNVVIAPADLDAGRPLGRVATTEPGARRREWWMLVSTASIVAQYFTVAWIQPGDVHRGSVGCTGIALFVMACWFGARAHERVVEGAITALGCVVAMVLLTNAHRASRTFAS